MKPGLLDVENVDKYKATEMYLRYQIFDQFFSLVKVGGDDDLTLKLAQ